MIHITIPDTKLIAENAGPKYNVFNIHINGSLHASIRYSQLLRLYDVLSREYGSTLALPEFPPKKIRHHLSEKQLSERKLGLLRFLQAIVQHPVTCTHPTVQKFFLDAQVESFRPTTSNISIDVVQADGIRHSVRCSVDSGTNVVLEIVEQSLGIMAEHRQYFALFLVKKKQKGYSIVRWLKDFESPYISLQLANQRGGQMHEIMIKKCCWDLALEQGILEDAAAIELLFAEAVLDVNSNNISVPADILQRLRTLQQQKSVKEYLKLCQIQPRYGYIVLEPCVSQYPQPDTRADLRVGRRQIVIAYPDRNSGEPVESVFRATRIRIWKIVTRDEKGYSMLFEFEYLMARDHFEWITIHTDQAVFLSLCLQSMGNEIIKHQSGQTQTQALMQQDAPCSSTSNRYESLNDVIANSCKRTANSSSPLPNDAFSTITDDDL